MTAAHFSGGWFVVVRRLVLAVLVMALVGGLPAVSGAGERAAGGPVSPTALFPDVPDDHPFVEAIGWLVAEGITSGYANGLFRPAGGVSRQEMAAFLWRLEGEPAPGGSAPSFPDVGSGHPFHTAISWLAGEGITTGYSNGQFRPGGPVTRQEMAAFLWRLEGEPAPSGSAPSFPDVGPGHPFRTAISWLAGEGITTGYADGKFRPAGGVSRQEMAAFLFRLRGEDPDDEVILSPDTIVLDGAEVAAISGVTDGSVSFTSLPGELATLAPGNILNAGISAMTPGGLLRRVTAVTPAGAGAVATTEMASLDEAIEEGTIDESFALDAGTAQVASASGGPALPGGSPTAGVGFELPFDETISSGAASLNAKGSVTIGADLDLDVDIDKFPVPKLKSGAVTAEVSEAVDVDVTMTAEGEWDKTVELGEIEFGTYQVPVGPLLVVVTPEIDFELLLEAEAKGAVTVGAAQSGAVSASVHYDQTNGWGNTQSLTNSPPTLSGPTLDAEASAKATLKPIVELEFYKVADIGAAVAPYVELEADLCVAKVSAGLDLSFEAEAEIWGLDLIDESFGPFNLYDTELHNAPIPGAPPTCLVGWQDDPGWVGWMSGRYEWNDGLTTDPVHDVWHDTGSWQDTSTMENLADWSGTKEGHTRHIYGATGTCFDVDVLTAAGSGAHAWSFHGPGPVWFDEALGGESESIRLDGLDAARVPATRATTSNCHAGGVQQFPDTISSIRATAALPGGTSPTGPVRMTGDVVLSIHGTDTVTATVCLTRAGGPDADGDGFPDSVDPGPLGPGPGRCPS